MKEYKGLTLSEFQIEAFESIDRGESVIVSTHTGNGKTLVADYAVEKCIKENQKAIYTAPIKALSNQKYRQFVAEYGYSKIGLLTGDITINRNANILVATTEILRNILRSEEQQDQFKIIILDEIHYLNDDDRGTVWEEVIITKSPETNLIGLSATIPNFLEICEWAESIHQKPVNAVIYPERFVKQEMSYFHKKLGVCSFDKLMSEYQTCDMEDRAFQTTFTKDMLNHVKGKDLFPVLYFVFSRTACEDKAIEMASKFDLLTAEEKEALAKAISGFEIQNPDIPESESWKALKHTLSSGIGFHHAGVLPSIKVFMEEIFQLKICKVLFATETFAVGINFPVRTVCFDSLVKYDGEAARPLNGSEFLQMAGRAGRRGLDDIGYVFVVANKKDLDDDCVFDIRNVKPEAVYSKFALSDNMVINLTRPARKQSKEDFFSRSLASYQYRKRMNQLNTDIEHKYKMSIEAEKELLTSVRCPSKSLEHCSEYRSLIKNNQGKVMRCAKKKRMKCHHAILQVVNQQKEIKNLKKNLQRKGPELKFLQAFEKRKNFLTNLGYISKDNKILPRGEFCGALHTSEVFITELYFNGFFHDNPWSVINGVLAGILSERKNTKYFKQEQEPVDYQQIADILESLTNKEIAAGFPPSYSFDKYISEIMTTLSNGRNFIEIAKESEIPEGDLSNLCKRVTDTLKQLKAVNRMDKSLFDKLNLCISSLDFNIISEIKKEDVKNG